ncbi:MAG TPA: glycoside hydrolase family 28 protein [Bryobacteraceae bacterium]|nr:glycoside hydrolase family 28 protein [Bryobacteraceae bacterium]
MRLSLLARAALLGIAIPSAVAAQSPGSPAGDRAFFNVLDYGAKRDGSGSSTAAFRSAIEACAKAGGGTVFIPAGQYVSGAIELVSNLTLYIDAGAVIKFAANREEYPMVKSRFEGVETQAPAAMIGGHNLENVAITGRGTIMAVNADWRALMSDQSNRAAWTDMLGKLERKESVREEQRAKAALSLRADFIRPVESKNVLIEGIHIMGGPMWVLHILYCENVVIRNVVVESFPGANTDGVDVDSSRHVRISDSYFDTGDDAICLKSGKDADGLRVNRATEDVAITNCTIHRGHGAVVLGSETSGGIRNVVASNIVSQGTDRGIRIKSTRGRGGVLENIRFDNWVIEDTPNPAIEVTNYYTRAPAEPVSVRTPVFRNFAISHVTINRCKTAVSIEGLPEMPVEGLRLTDIVANAKEGLRAFNTKGLELHNVQINPEEGIPFLIRDSTELDLDGVQTRNPKPGVPVVRLDRSRNVSLRNSLAWPGSDVFLSMAPGMKIFQTSNDLSAAASASKDEEMDAWKGINTPDRPQR